MRHARYGNAINPSIHVPSIAHSPAPTPSCAIHSHEAPAASIQPTRFPRAAWRFHDGQRQCGDAAYSDAAEISDIATAMMVAASGFTGSHHHW
mgnify:CR=1 FL=1